MSVECPSCSGKGFIVKGEQTCSNCNGTGKVKSVNLVGHVGEGPEEAFWQAGFARSVRAPVRSSKREKCQACGGSGKAPVCEICGKAVAPGQEMCSEL